MKVRFVGAVGLWAIISVLSVGAMAMADSTSHVVYSYKDWEVRVVHFDDGTNACEAEVSYPNESFSVWADKSNPIKLQFYYSGWSFGDSAADLKLQIDAQSPWTLHNANLYKESILFDLPGTEAGTRFLTEVAHGNTIYLMDEKGKDVQNYSLSGSRAAILALVDCVGNRL